MARQCLFCEVVSDGESPTREHVVPDWVNDEVQVSDVVVRVAPDDTELYRTSRLNIVVRQLCSTCNSGRLAELEGEVRRFLAPAMRNDGGVLFSPKRCELTALWAVKTAILLAVATSAHRKTELYTPLDHLPVLYETRLPAEGTQVCLFAVDADQRVVESDAGTFYGDDGKPEATLFTFTVGRLGFHVMTQRLGLGAPPLHPGPPVSDVLVRIWPERPSLVWPAAPAIRQSDFRALVGWPIEAMRRQRALGL